MDYHNPIVHEFDPYLRCNGCNVVMWCDEIYFKTCPLCQVIDNLCSSCMLYHLEWDSDPSSSNEIPHCKSHMTSYETDRCYFCDKFNADSVMTEYGTEEEGGNRTEEIYQHILLNECKIPQEYLGINGGAGTSDIRASQLPYQRNRITRYYSYPSSRRRHPTRNRWIGYRQQHPQPKIDTVITSLMKKQQQREVKELSGILLRQDEQLDRTMFTDYILSRKLGGEPSTDSV